MRFAVETWDPDYAADLDDGPPEAAEAEVDAGVEVPAASWSARHPRGPARQRVVFVDGVRRIDARVWLVDAGDARPGELTRPDLPVSGLCASVAAGAVRCRPGGAEVAETLVGRGLFTTSGAVEAIATPFGRYRPRAVPDGDPAAATLAVQAEMADLEHRAAAAAGHPDATTDGNDAVDNGGAADDGEAELVVLDGPLRDRHRLPGAVGYIKTQRRSYLGDEQAPVLAALDTGERTPLFLIGGARPRWSWYLRLPGPRAHAWSGVVRCEVAGRLDLDAAITRADDTTATLVRFASSAHRDPRAPQNLVPIGGLEARLRHRLGDRVRVLRGLQAAAGPPPGPSPLPG